MLDAIPDDICNTVIPKLRCLRRGEKVVYHVGYLPRDRNVLDADPPVKREWARSVGLIATTALELEKVGAMHLVQRRKGMMDYEYVAIGR